MNSESALLCFLRPFQTQKHDRRVSVSGTPVEVSHNPTLVLEHTKQNKCDKWFHNGIEKSYKNTEGGAHIRCFYPSGSSFFWPPRSSQSVLLPVVIALLVFGTRHTCSQLGALYFTPHAGAPVCSPLSPSADWSSRRLIGWETSPQPSDHGDPSAAFLAIILLYFFIDLLLV